MSQSTPKNIASLNVINPNDKVEQLRREFSADLPQAAGGGGLLERDPNLPLAKQQLQAQIIEALKQVYDPEIPVDIYELGLIYAIDIADDNAVKVKMTLTAPGCPVAGSIVDEVNRRVESVDAVRSCHVDLVFDPPWSKERMSEEALLELDML